LHYTMTRKIIIINRETVTVITEDSRETTFLFQRLSVALQRGNVVSFLDTFWQDLSVVNSHLHLLLISKLETL